MSEKAKTGTIILCVPIVSLIAFLCFREYQYLTAKDRLKRTLRSMEEDMHNAGFERGPDGNWSVLKPPATNSPQSKRILTHIAVQPEVKK